MRRSARWLALTGLVLAPACSGDGAAERDASATPPDAAPAADAAVDARPGGSPVRWMLHGGGREDDDVFAAFVAAAGGGHIVTLGAVANAGDYPDLLFWDGYFTSLGASSAETVNTESRADAMSTEIAAALGRADGVFFRGGDQARYLAHWAGTPVQDALVAAAARGAVLGGSSAGAMVLGSPIYDARVGGVTSWEALLDPFDPYITFAEALVPGPPNLLVDTHCTERGRLGRALVFALRAPFEAGPAPLVVCVDPRTAVFVREDGTFEVVGRGAALLIDRSRGAWTVEAGRAPAVSAAGVWQLPAGYVGDLEALREGRDPIVSRPAYVAPVDAAGAPVGPLPAVTLDGDDAALRTLGSRQLVGLDDDPDAWRRGEIGLAAGDGQLPGVLVVTRLYGSSAYFENHQGGMVWALATEPETVVVGVDLGLTATTAAPRTIGADGDGYALVLDGRTASHAGTPTGGWQTAAVEGATIRVVTADAPWDGAPRAVIAPTLATERRGGPPRTCATATAVLEHHGLPSTQIRTKLRSNEAIHQRSLHQPPEGSCCRSLPHRGGGARAVRDHTER